MFFNYSQCGPDLFSLCSHQVPNVFLKMFPISIHFFFPILFGHGSTYVYRDCKGGSKGKHETKHASILGRGSIFRLLCQGVPHVPKNLVMGQSNGSFSGKKLSAHPFTN